MCGGMLKIYSLRRRRDRRSVADLLPGYWHPKGIKGETIAISHNTVYDFRVANNVTEYYILLLCFIIWVMPERC